MANDDIFKQLAEFEAPGALLGDIQTPNVPAPLPVGLQSFEDALYFRAGCPDLVVMAARPGHGKTVLLCQLAAELARTKAVHLFSLEMTKEQLKERLVKAEGATALAGRQLYIDDTNGLDINTLYARVVARNRRTPLAAVFVDYLQIVSTPVSRSKTEEVNLIAQRLKDLAKELNIPVVVAAQMNRNVEGRLAAAKHKELVRPLMSDVADSAGIEKWADTLMFLHRQWVNGAESPNAVTMCVNKARHGRVRDVKLHFRGDLLKFYDRGFAEEDLI